MSKRSQIADWGHPSHCLNCGSRLSGNFCSNCGQKSQTHRFRVDGEIVEDVLSNTFQMDKGLFRTLFELFARPGHMVREFIEGKRRRHINYLALILIS